MNWFKKSPKPEFNVSHPEVAHQVEVAFKVKGKKYYRFKEEKLIPAGRYKYIYAYLKEVDLRMNIDTLKKYVEDFKNILNGGGGKKTINMTDLMRLVLNLESRVALAFEPDTVERLAAVIYFDDTEDLSTYDRKYGTKKIEFWKENNVLDFFLTKPMQELLGLKDISTTFLEGYIQELRDQMGILTADHQQLSSANFSENGKTHS